MEEEEDETLRSVFPSFSPQPVPVFSAVACEAPRGEEDKVIKGSDDDKEAEEEDEQEEKEEEEEEEPETQVR